MSRIGHASHDEFGRYSGGCAGDQTGQEVYIRDFYKRPWSHMIVPVDPTIREHIASAMEEACANDNIGYDQGTSGNSNDRYTLYAALEKNGRQMSKVQTKCETDCSNLVAMCARCAGVNISPYIYTGNERQAFLNAKDFNGNKVEFVVYSQKKYTDSPDYCPRGTILLYEGHHTGILLDSGKYWREPSPVEIKEIPIQTGRAGLKIVGASTLNVRKTPETGEVVKALKSGERVQATAKALVNGTYWFKIGDNQWISGKYVTGWVFERNQNRWWFVKQNYTYDTNKVVQIDGAWFAFDKDGWCIMPDRINSDGSIKIT